ncbi:hypothetical protein C1Y40_05827 [Mycobacterium talmoniae]|uniref:Uncharacterized protein n=1 Tax=Mycobacterium talmoniae TaxID=1858794 RepID=A0A2S8BBI7_9MYCO|nr:hypothetical protein C1Y40_05827 [Mycobacterium talmoniae]
MPTAASAMVVRHASASDQPSNRVSDPRLSDVKLPGTRRANA